MAVCATGQCLAFLQVVVDIRVDDQPHRTCRFFDLGPQTIPEAEHHAGPEILCPEHGHHQFIGTAAAPQTPGSHIGLVAKPCRRRKNFSCVAVLIFRSAALPPKTILTVLDEIPTSCAICLIVTMLFPTFF